MKKLYGFVVFLLLILLSSWSNLSEQNGYEWVKFDINGDGVEELLLQSKTHMNSYMRRIVSIYAFNSERQETELVFHQNAGLTRFLFLAKSGNIVHYDFTSGVILGVSFSHRAFDEQWRETTISTLGIVYIYDLSELPEDWAKNNPDMAEPGIYFIKTVGGYREFIDEVLFIVMFEEMTGFSFYNAKPDWF